MFCNKTRNLPTYPHPLESLRLWNLAIRPDNLYSKLLCALDGDQPLENLTYHSARDTNTGDIISGIW